MSCPSCNPYSLCESDKVLTSLSTSFITPVVQLRGTRTDAFGNLAVASPVTTFTSHPAFTPQNEFLDYHSTGSASVFVDISNTVVVLTASNSGGKAVRQSHEYLLYQPGKSHVVYFTMVPKYSGNFNEYFTIRAGIFDDYRDKNTPGSTYPGIGLEVNQPSMGHFFELSGNSWFVVERYNSPDNLANVTRVPQSNWNGDTLNGNPATSESGFVLDGVTANSGYLFWIERQWLGVGVVRMGLSINGLFVTAHTFQNRMLNRSYTHLPKLPLRYEIEKVAGGPTSNVGSVGTICMSAQIVGDYLPIGSLFSLPGNLVAGTARIGTTYMSPIFMLRLQQKYCRATFKLKDLEFYGAAAGIYGVYKNPTIVGGTVTWIDSPDPKSMIQYAIFPSGTTSVLQVTGGFCIRSGFFAVRTSVQDSLSIDELFTTNTFGSDIHGTCDILCITAMSFSPNNDVTANARWIELV